MFRQIKLLTSVLALLLVALLSTQTCTVQAQMLDPVDWEISAEAQENGEYLLIFKAKIDEGWKIYGQNIEAGGPVATAIFFEDSSAFEFVDEEWKALGRKETGHDPYFDMEVSSFKKTAIFRRAIKPKSSGTIKGYVEFMTCDATQCLPPDEEEFALKVEASDGSTGSVEMPGLEGSPVAWKVWSSQVGPDEYIIHYGAEIADGWKLYGLKFKEDKQGPEPTVISIADGELVGEMVALGELYEAFEPLFDMELNWYKKKVEFQQQVKVADASKPLEGSIEFMSCDQGSCVFPPAHSYTLDLATGKSEVIIAEANEVIDEADSDECGTILLAGATQKEQESKAYWIVFLLGMAGGFIALLTPCVFPMIPLTVSFFTKRSETKAKGVFNAWFYGLCIVAVYFILALPFLIFDLPSDTLSTIATSVELNMVFFIIFIFFAGSFFGYYDISLPQSWSNRADKASEAGGLIGIFFMAVTLALVSFSCTGPILGSLLVGAATGAGSQYALVWGMVGFGVALALPFGIFAGFPSMLNSLPKSGGWLNTVKVVLGFLEVGFAFKFLSNADLVIQTGLLKREIFLIIWVLVCLGIAVYILGFIRFPHDSPKTPRSIARFATAALFAGLTIYLAPGVFGKNLGLISGFPPPIWYSFSPPGTPKTLADGRDVYSGDVLYSVSTDQSKIINKETGEAVTEPDLVQQVLHDQEHFASCPGGLMCFHDWNEGVAFANKYNKPIMIDFTGWACVNCRRMEENVWVKPEVDRIIREDYVLISLYVDDKRKLPEDEVYKSCNDGRVKKTIGKKWADFQATNFGVVSQPYYVLLTADGEVLNETAYTPDVGQYVEFLQTGLDKYNQIAGKVQGPSAAR